MLGAAQFRAGRNKDAIATLTKSLPERSEAAISSPDALDQIQVGRLLGETILTLAYDKQGDKEALGKQLAVVNDLIGRLEKSPPKPSPNNPPWLVPFAIEIAKRELARIESPPSDDGK